MNAMDLNKMAEDIRAKYSVYGNAHLEILEAHETFKVRMSLGPETENHLKMMHERVILAAAENMVAGKKDPMAPLAKILNFPLVPSH